MNLINISGLKFDRLLPIYNWLYPLAGRPSEQYTGSNAIDVFSTLEPSAARALYLHIPFCETICTFCPFVRAGFKGRGIVDAYVDALETEIELKARFASLTGPPVRAIFVGGGTPSLLDPVQIRRVGDAISRNFDLSRLTEFSFEVEVKSVTPERVEAMRDIGVTHARFGLQTFSPEYREFFNLTATIEQIESASRMLRDAFPYVSCDILYGMNGESVDQLRCDIDSVCELGMRNVDIYPINNVVTQPKLHAAFEKAGRKPTSGLTKLYMNMFVREAMLAHGYLPHNGHGYVKVPQEEIDRGPVVTDLYSFVYHEHVYGYPGYDLLGFGTNAISSFSGFSASNTSSRNVYIESLAEGALPMIVQHHDEIIDLCRPLSLALPYHGVTEKSWIDWSRLPESMSDRLEQLIAHDLVIETERTYELTRQGWEWYSSVMYYLLPPDEQRAVDRIVRSALRDERRTIEPTGLEYIPLDVI